MSNIYHILKYLANNNIDVVRTVARSYTSSNKWQDMCKEFNERVVMVIIRHIEAYLTKIGINMGMDETTKYSITVNNGQVNLASEHATINAVQYNGVNVQQLDELITSIKKEITSEVSEEDVEVIEESIDVIKNEIVQVTPKKSLIKTAITGLQTIKGTAEFGAAVIALVQFVQTFI